MPILFLLEQAMPILKPDLSNSMKKHPDRVFITIGYDEEKAHLLEAGCDIFLMPSRFEPCGLNQMYSLRYGTLPIVHRTGGLADTVIDAGITTDTPQKLTPGANGFVFDTPTTDSLIQTIQRALSLFEDKKLWQQLQRNAMNEDFSWEKSAESYIKIYNNLNPNPDYITY